MKKKVFFSKSKFASKGLSLIEVLMAVVLLAIIATPLIQVIYTSISLNIKSRELLAASNCAESLMEYLEVRPKDDILADVRKQTPIDDSAGMFSYVAWPCFTKSYRVVGHSDTANDAQLFIAAFDRYKYYDEDGFDDTLPGGVYYSTETDSFMMGMVEYEGQKFDILVSYTPFININTTPSDDYSLYEINVKVLRYGKGSIAGHSSEDILSDINGSIVIEN